MVKEDGFEPPNLIKIENIIPERNYLLTLSHQIHELLYDILEVFIASIKIHHTLNNPLFFNLII